VTTLAVEFADAEVACVDYLTEQLTDRGETVTVGVGLRGSWTKAAAPHVGVEVDGTLVRDYPIVGRATVRVTVWSSGNTTSKRLAGLCMALLLSHPGDDDLWSVSPLTGVLPARDPDNSAPIASITVRANCRPTVVS
jgi:hypothetical protein